MHQSPALVLPPQLMSGKKLVNNILSDFPF